MKTYSILLFINISLLAFAQTPKNPPASKEKPARTGGSVRGTVTWSTPGSPAKPLLVGGTMRLHILGQGVFGQTKTDKNGAFSLSTTKDGYYSLEVRVKEILPKCGFDGQIRDVGLDGGLSAKQNFRLDCKE
jgi:hypothetical protein